MGYLDKINSPDDLKKLEIKKLDILAKEIREFLVSSVSKTGGHLASNLGVVELTIAIHYCFNLPKDKVIWDVGHQSYIHKILTGRKNEFASLRKLDGMSGFPKTNESKYDCFNTGHSTTSISAALGMAEARDLKKADYNIVAVIGDGSMTGGLAYEALNNAASNNTKLLIILNDNQMSISENVGAMSRYLNELRTTPEYLNAKQDIRDLLLKVPVVGKPACTVIGKTKNRLKKAIVPHSVFESFGAKYVGPIDGHDIRKLVNILNKIKTENEPILLHVITTKGKGYNPAEKEPSRFHGTGEFEVETGKSNKVSGGETYSEVFGKAMVKIARKNKKLVAITAAMPSGTGLTPFALEFPDRIFDVGIAEEHAVIFAAGIAKGGLIPVFVVYSTFLQRSYDQIIHDVCLQKLHVIFAIDRAGIVGDDGETHQGIYDLSFLSHIPNLIIMAPKNKFELENMLDFAVKENAPIAIRYPRGAASEVLNSIDTPIELGKSELIYSGEKIAILSFGAMMDTALEVYGNLIKEGYSPQLINVRFLAPLDTEMLDIIKMDFKYIFTVEDNIISGGLGVNILQYLAGNGCFNNVFKAFAFPDTFIEHGTRAQLFKKYELDGESISKAILEIIRNNE